MNAFLHSSTRALAVAVVALLALAGCESLNSISPSKRIDYKSSSSGPALELPPDLTTPRYDDRYQVTTATGIAAAGANKGTKSEFLPQTPDAKIVRAGNERWLVVRATPEQAWNTSREFWQENGFVLAQENPQVGIMETDFAENRAEIPQDFLRRTVGKFIDAFYTTYKQDKFKTRIERGAEPNTVEIFISHRGMEQVPTGKIDNSSPAAFAVGRDAAQSRRSSPRC
jgi:outer membrane protein assembly factor BamC